MADIIEVNFRTKKRIEKYTILKNVCVVCFNSVIYDSRREDNSPYIELEKNKGNCICKDCAVAIKEVVDANEWDK
jgi:hypothetical protein